MNWGVFALVTFGNLWIWRVFSFSAALAILVVLCTFSFYLLVNKHNPKKSLKVFLLLLLPLLFFQWKTTDKFSLTKLSNIEQHIQQMRLREYPSVKVDLLEKTIWIPIAHWFEGRTESIAFFRILDNFSQTIDPNLYFFANHPRERLGFGEFEKFPFIFLPFSVYGVLYLVNKKMGKELVLSIAASIILLSFIGTWNPLGPFSLFPFIGVATIVGTERFIVRLEFLAHKKIIYFGLGTFYLLILIQAVSYAIN